MANRYCLPVEDFKLEINKRAEIRKQMINKRVLKGYTFEQAEAETMRCLYIAGFDGATFKD